MAPRKAALAVARGTTAARRPSAAVARATWLDRAASEPRLEDHPADVPLGVLTHAIERAGAHPQHRAPQVRRVAPELRVEEAGGGGLGPQERVRVVEVLPSLRDRPRGVVVEGAVLVTGDDVARLQRLDPVDRLAPRAEAADRALPEVHVDAVVDRVAGDDELEVRDVQDRGVVAVGVADLDDRELVVLEGEAVVRHRDGGDG